MNRRLKLTKGQQQELRELCEETFVEGFQEIQSYAHQVACDKGWWDCCKLDLTKPLDSEIPSYDEASGEGSDCNFQPSMRNTGEAIALMHSELSEALEWYRKGNVTSDHIAPFLGVEEEFADVIIRIMDFAEANKLDICGAVLAKMKFNEGREQMHGGKKF